MNHESAIRAHRTAKMILGDKAAAAPPVARLGGLLLDVLIVDDFAAADDVALALIVFVTLFDMPST